MTQGGHPEGRTLWLLRHAKAAEAAPGGTDRSRPLTHRGHRDAAALGRRLPSLVPPGASLPDVVLCSAATRTTETAADVADGLGIPVDRRQSLYYASPDDVLAEIRAADDHVRSLMVVGHNPATHTLALGLLGDGDADRSRLDRFPTCALAVYRLPAARWAHVDWGTGTLAGFFTPPY